MTVAQTPAHYADGSVRPMLPTDIPAGLALCRAAGWNQTADDWALVLEHSHGRARVILHDDSVVGTVTAVDYQQRFGWVGMVLVDEQFRKQGLGTRLLSLALDQLQSCETVKLDATPAGRAVYLPLGFVDEWGLLRMETIARLIDGPTDESVRAMTAEDLPHVLAWDQEVFGADRSAILLRYRELVPEFASVAYQESHLVGYSFGRRGFRWDQVGPIVAKDRRAAQALLSAAMTRSVGKPLLVDTRVANPVWVNWLRSLGFAEQRPYTRMYKGPNRHPGEPDRQYTILGPELG